MSPDVPIETPAPHSEGQHDVGRDRFAKILSGLSWNTGGQVVTVALNLVLTPFLLLHLGVSRYGLYALLSSFAGCCRTSTAVSAQRRHATSRSSPARATTGQPHRCS